MTVQATSTKQTVDTAHIDSKHIKCVARQDIPEHNIAKGETFLLKKVGPNTYEIKKLVIISRKELASGSISCTVKNGDDREYTVILNRSRQHTCTCDAYTKGHQGCYHVGYVKSIENAKIQAARRKRQQAAALNGSQGFSLLKTA